MLDSWAGKSGAVVTCICAGIIGTLLLMVWIASASAAPQAPGVELGPDHTQQVNPGQTVRYNHTLTNTGTTTDVFLVEATSTQRWPVELIAGIHSTEGLTLSLHVGTQMTASFQVSLTVPPQVCGVTEVTVVTATSQLSPAAQDTAIDQTIVSCKMYLPLVMKRWPPIPYQPTLNPISNPDADGNYYITWTERPSHLADTYTLQEATDAAFTTSLCDVCTTPWQSCSVTNNQPGTYYYRVRGQNTWGYGAWSNLQTVIVGPTPYNLSAQQIVLQLDDMPPGYALDEEESGSVDLSDALLQMGAVEGYEVTYTNFDLFFTGTPLVYNLAVVFRTTGGARSHIQLVRQNIENDPDATFISCPTFGDETVAGKIVAQDDPYVAYAIAFRKGNLTSSIGTGGFLGIAKFDDAISFARKARDRINDQIGAGVQATGNEGKRSLATVEPVQSWVSANIGQRIRKLRSVLWTSEN
jgi:hypothetical protein